MRILDVTPISDAAEFPVKKGTLQFLQDAYKEMLAAIMQALLSPGYNPNTMYAIFGCNNTSTAPNYTIASGVIFYQGELFVVPAQNFTAPGGQVAVCGIVSSQYGINADPVLFTDNTPRNVHDIRQMIITSGTSGSGTVGDYSTINFASFVIPKELNLTAPPAGNAVVVGGTYPNITVFVPVSNNLHPCLDAGQINVGDVPGGGTPGVTLTVTLNNPQADGNYYVVGTLISEAGSPQSDATVVWVIPDSSRTATQFTVHFAEVASAVQALKFEWMIFSKA